MRRSAAAILAGILFLAGCGKKGAILPPLVRVPQPPEFTALVQRGAHLVLEWNSPIAAIDGSALPGPVKIEVWGAEELPGRKPPQAATEPFGKKAALLAVIPSGSPPSALLPLDPAKADGRALVVGLKAVDARRRISEFSALKSLTLRPLPLPPKGLRAEVGPQAVNLTWEASPGNIDGSPAGAPSGFRVLRAEADGPYILLGPVPAEGAAFQDTGFEFGRRYRYIVRTAVSFEGQELESDDSPALEVFPRDTFPPAAPSGLTALPGEDYISLAWNPGPDTDVAGYRVWRREEGRGEFRDVGPGLLSEPAFVDRSVEKAVRYEYAISAEDKNGNRSPLSEGVTESRRAARA